MKTKEGLAFLVWLAATAWAGTVEAVPNILLIVSEDNGPELGCYGDPYARTPKIDKLASEGVLFENAFVPYSVCSPSRACFLTGLYPHQNGQVGLANQTIGAMYQWAPTRSTSTPSACALPSFRCRRSGQKATTSRIMVIVLAN